MLVMLATVVTYKIILIQANLETPYKQAALLPWVTSAMYLQ